MTRQETMEYLQTSLKALFPNNGVRVNLIKLLGQESISVRYTHNLDASTCSSNIIENDPAFMSFYIGKVWPARTGQTKNLWYIEYPSTHCNRLMGRGKPLNFRKLRGNTEHEAAEKLVAWFTKHQALILTADTLPRF